MYGRNLQTNTDTTIKIWDYLYKVRVPYQQSRSIDDLKKFGTPLTGVKAIDDSKNSEWITTMKSIADMIDYFKDGVPVGVVIRSDIEHIYKAIQEHIHAWKQRLETGVNIGDAPMEDLIAMDEFAETVFSYAKYEHNDNIHDGLIVRQFGIDTAASTRNFFNRNLTKSLTEKQTDSSGTITINSSEDDLPTRDNLSDFFKTRTIRL